MIADAWGNIIDQVCYSDSLPWPMEADGNGAYLQLKELDSDNSLAENWTTGDDLTSITEQIDNRNIRLYPNPTSGLLHIIVAKQAVSCQVFDMLGSMLSETEVIDSQFDFDMSGLASGVYLIKINLADGASAYDKVVKR